MLSRQSDGEADEDEKDDEEVDKTDEADGEILDEEGMKDN